MKNGKILESAISTMLYSWGGDTPPEAYWAYAELVMFINKETGSSFLPLEENAMTDDEQKENGKRLEALSEFLKSDVCN